MSNLTIDQILAESRNEVQIFDVNKEASAKASDSSGKITSEEIEKMAGLLRDAELPEGLAVTADLESFEEKVAQALILNQTLQDIAHVQEGEEKLAEFREAALKAGYAPSKVDEYIEKKAGMTMWGSLGKAFKSPIAKGVAATAALAAATGGGYEAGEYRTTEKAKKVIKNVGTHAYTSGLKRGYGAGFSRGAQRGASVASDVWRRKLQGMHSASTSKGK